MQIGNTTINFINPPEQSKESLKRLYDTCNRIFKEDKYFYTKEEFKKIKKDKSNILL